MIDVFEKMVFCYVPKNAIQVRLGMSTIIIQMSKIIHSMKSAAHMNGAFFLFKFVAL